MLPQAGDSIMVAHSALTEAALGMSLGYFFTDIAVIVYHFPDMVQMPVFKPCHRVALSCLRQQPL